MDYPDAMIKIALERQVEWVRQVQACGATHRPEQAAPAWSPSAVRGNRRPAGLTRAGHLLAALLIVLLLALACSTAGAARLWISVIR